MAVRQELCFIAVCDLCGTDETAHGYTPHAASEEIAIAIVTETCGNNPNPKHGWTVTPDGLLVCDTVDDEAHRTAHEEAGKTISDCAMTVVFDRADEQQAHMQNA